MLTPLFPPPCPNQFGKGTLDAPARKALLQGAGAWGQPHTCPMPALGTASHHRLRHLGGGHGPPIGRAPPPWPCGAHSTGSSCQWLWVAQWGWVSSCPSSVSSGLNDRRHQLVRQGSRQGCFLRTSHPQPLSYPWGRQQSAKTLPGLPWDKVGRSQQGFYLPPVSLSHSAPDPSQLPHIPGRDTGDRSRASDCTTFLLRRKMRRRK